LLLSKRALRLQRKAEADVTMRFMSLSKAGVPNWRGSWPYDLLVAPLFRASRIDRDAPFDAGSTWHGAAQNLAKRRWRV